MPTRKKRSLSNVKVTDVTGDDAKKVKKVTPAVSNFIASSNEKSGQAVRGVEFLVDPDTCKPWKYHNRDEAWMTPERCSDLISSIRKNGQQFPIIARKLEDDPDGKAWEIIAGRRRWFACGYLNKQLRVKAFTGGDREAAIIMNLENKDRDDISEFEDAISYKQQLDAGLFQTQDEMSAALDIKKSKLSKMLAAAKILKYKQVMNLFPDITKIKINPVYNIVSLIEKSEENRKLITNKADSLYHKWTKQGKNLPCSTIMKALVGAVVNRDSAGRHVKPKTYKINGKAVFKTSFDPSGKLTLAFTDSKNFEGNLTPLKKEICNVLDELFDDPVS